MRKWLSWLVVAIGLAVVTLPVLAGVNPPPHGYWMVDGSGYFRPIGLNGVPGNSLGRIPTPSDCVAMAWDEGAYVYYLTSGGSLYNFSYNAPQNARQLRVLDTFGDAIVGMVNVGSAGEILLDVMFTSAYASYLYRYDGIADTLTELGTTPNPLYSFGAIGASMYANDGNGNWFLVTSAGDFIVVSNVAVQDLLSNGNGDLRGVVTPNGFPQYGRIVSKDGSYVAINNNFVTTKALCYGP